MTPRYFIDAEFHESGYGRPIELISLGVVCDDGREFYAVAGDGWDKETVSDWLKENVLPHLHSCHACMDVPGSAQVYGPRSEIAKMLAEFIQDEPGGDKPEIWGYYSDYDWVILCQLFGRMIDLPKHFPKICLDIKQRCISLGNPRLPRQESHAHNALADARHNKVMFDFLTATEAATTSNVLLAEGRSKR
jgi:hypothetical protein